MYPYPHGNAMPPYDQQNLIDLCKKYKMHLMLFETMDGQMFPGIVDNVDDDGVEILVPDGDNFNDYDDDNDYDNDYDYKNWDRQFAPWYGGYGFIPYGYPPFWYGYPRIFRRFRRRRYPFRVLRRIMFPFFY